MTFFILSILSILSLALVLAGIHLYRFQKTIEQQKVVINKLSSNLNATSNGAMGLGNRLLALERQFKDLKSRQQDMLSFGNEDQFQKRTYKQASQLAQMGATIDELKQSCELSHGEAELLAHMKLSTSH